MQGNQAQAEETWLTLTEVCARLRMSPRTAKKRIASGELEAIKIGTALNAPLRISERAVADFENRRKVQAS